MTNEEIIKQVESGKYPEFHEYTYKKTLELMELARQDEREKMQGVDCNCLRCSPNVFPNLRFNVCSICGNKRCPHASDHNYECTNSNEPGQCKKFRIAEKI